MAVLCLLSVNGLAAERDISERKRSGYRDISALVSGLARRNSVNLPAGRFYSLATIRIPSGCRLRGSGFATEIRAVGDFPVVELTNAAEAALERVRVTRRFPAPQES